VNSLIIIDVFITINRILIVGVDFQLFHGLMYCEFGDFCRNYDVNSVFNSILSDLNLCCFSLFVRFVRLNRRFLVTSEAPRYHPVKMMNINY